MKVKVVRIPRYTNEEIEVVKEIDLSTVRVINPVQSENYTGINIFYTGTNKFGLCESDMFLDTEDYTYSIFVNTK